MKPRHRTGALASAALGVLIACGSPASAQLVKAGTFKNLTYEQTGPSTVTANGGFFNAQAFFTSPGDFATATLTYPGPGSPESLPMDTPTSFGIGPSFASQADMDAAYPFGTYTFDLMGGTFGPTTVSVDYMADAYTGDVPRLAAASFSALQGLSTALSSFTLNFNSFTPSPLATSAFTFFTIFGSSQSCGFLAPSSTSCTIDPQALAPGATYGWELDFSDRVESDVNGVLTYTDFDVRTDGSFTTAVPEASTWAMLLVGFAGLGYAGRRAVQACATV